jgi:hypothetical protein
VRAEKVFQAQVKKNERCQAELDDPGNASTIFSSLRKKASDADRLCRETC